FPPRRLLPYHARMICEKCTLAVSVKQLWKVVAAGAALDESRLCRMSRDDAFTSQTIASPNQAGFIGAQERRIPAGRSDQLDCPLPGRCSKKIRKRRLPAQAFAELYGM